MFAKKQRFSFKTKLPSNLFSSQSFSVRYGENAESLKVAVVVSKKVDRSAVARNKIKRRILEAVRKSFDMNTPVSLVFYAKGKALESSTIDAELKELILKIKHV